MLNRKDTYLDELLIRDIVAAVPRVLIMKHVASLCEVPYKTLNHWIRRGKKDIEEGKEGSIYAKLVTAYNKKRSEVLEEKLFELKQCPKNYGALTWTLEKCFREDFEGKSELHKQLEDIVFNYLKPIVDKSGFENVKEMLDDIGPLGEQG